MKIGDTIRDKSTGICYLYESDCVFRSINGEICCGVIYSIYRNNRVEVFTCDKNYFINNFEKCKRSI